MWRIQTVRFEIFVAISFGTFALIVHWFFLSVDSYFLLSLVILIGTFAFSSILLYWLFVFLLFLLLAAITIRRPKRLLNIWFLSKMIIWLLLKLWFRFARRLTGRLLLNIVFYFIISFSVNCDFILFHCVFIRLVLFFVQSFIFIRHTLLFAIFILAFLPRTLILTLLFLAANRRLCRRLIVGLRLLVWLPASILVDFLLNEIVIFILVLILLNAMPIVAWWI